MRDLPWLTVTDRYGRDVLAGDWRAPARGRSRPVPAETGLVVEDATTGWVGAVVRVEKAGGKVFKPKFPIGEYGFCALVTDTEGNMVGLHSMQ